jgi:hypothetical protein
MEGAVVFPIDFQGEWGINGKILPLVSITGDSGDIIKNDMSIEDGINGKIVFQGSSVAIRTITLRCLGREGVRQLNEALLLATSFETGVVINIVYPPDTQGISYEPGGGDQEHARNYYYYELSDTGNENILDKNNVQIYNFSLNLIGPADLGNFYLVP